MNTVYTISTLSWLMLHTTAAIREEEVVMFGFAPIFLYGPECQE